MKKRIMILMVLTIALLVLGGATSAGADAERKVTGGAQWWHPGFHGWFEVSIHEVAPDQAEGTLNLREYDEELGWRHWTGHPICVAFGEGFDGEPAASFVLQIDNIRGWGPGTAGQYAKLWLSDGGTPATEDAVGVIVWPPRDNQPNCHYKRPGPWAYWPFQAGNIEIQR